MTPGEIYSLEKRCERGEIILVNRKDWRIYDIFLENDRSTVTVHRCLDSGSIEDEPTWKGNHLVNEEQINVATIATEPPVGSGAASLLVRSHEHSKDSSGEGIATIATEPLVGSEQGTLCAGEPMNMLYDLGGAPPPTRAPRATPSSLATYRKSRTPVHTTEHSHNIHT